MSDYLQPDFYRFNQDSLNLVHFILKRISNAKQILDIGAGAGIIGVELAREMKVRGLTLLELQEEFRPYLEKNRNLFLSPEIQSEIIISSFGQWNTSKTFDLIVCNPPYYLPGHGQESADQRRNYCRNFKQDGWEILISKISQWLDPSGKAFIVIKNDPVIVKKCEEVLRLGALEGQFHQRDDLCFIELYPRD